MVGPSDLIFGVLIPFCIAFVLLLLGGRAEEGSPRPRPFLGALAIGLGYLGAHWMIVGSPARPFAGAQIGGRDWLWWIVAGAIVLAPLRALPALARWSGPLYMALFSVVVARYMLGPAATADARGMAVRLAFTFVIYVTWSLLERLALRASGPALPIGLVVAGSGIAVSALMVHMAVFAQLTGAVCAGLGAGALGALMRKGFTLPVGALAVAMIVFFGALAQAVVYDLPLTSLVLLVAACLAPWVTETRKLAGWSAVKRGLVSVAIAAVPAVVAVMIARAAGGSAES